MDVLKAILGIGAITGLFLIIGWGFGIGFWYANKIINQRFRD